MKLSNIFLMAAVAVMVAFFICFTLVTFGVAVPLIVAPIGFWTMAILGTIGTILAFKETS